MDPRPPGRAADDAGTPPALSEALEAWGLEWWCWDEQEGFLRWPERLNGWLGMPAGWVPRDAGDLIGCFLPLERDTLAQVFAGDAARRRLRLLHRRGARAEHAVLAQHLAVSDAGGRHRVLGLVHPVAEQDLTRARASADAGRSEEALCQRLQEALRARRADGRVAAVLSIRLGRAAGEPAALAGTYRAVLSGQLGGSEGAQWWLERLGDRELVVFATGLADALEPGTVAQALLQRVVTSDLPEAAPSIGIAVHPADGEDARTLLGRARRAAAAGADTGGGAWYYHDQRLGIEAWERLQMEADLRRAISAGELEVYYQPKVRVRDEAVVGMEALVRWRHPVLGLVPPARFIPLAERTGLIVPLGEWVLRAVCQQLAGWRDGPLGDLVCSVNLSPAQFADPHLLAGVRRILAETGAAPSRLQIELTENLLAEDVTHAERILGELRALGLGVAIDDFGVGYTSLSYLKRLPVDVLKIDRTFISGMLDNPDDAAIVAAITAMAQSLSLAVVAEGVEDELQLTVLAEHDCDEVQGYFYSPPLPADAFARWVAERGAGADPTAGGEALAALASASGS